MQTEKLPTAPPPPSDGQTEVPVKNTPAAQIAWSDRIFWWCFLPAVVVFALVCLWLNYADIYGTARTQEEQHRIKVQVYRPPLKRPKPKPKIIPPKPPKVPPKVVHLKTPPPRIIPRVVPHPPPPAPRAPAVGHTVKSNTPTAVPVGPVSQAPVAVPQTPGEDTRPQAPVVAPPAPPPPVIEKPAPPPPPVVHHEAPPPPPPPPPPKKPAIPDRDTPELQSGSFSDINLPDGVDVGSLNGSSTTVTWEVDASGRARNIKFRPTGNSDLDNNIREQISRFRYRPKIHNGEPEAVNIQHTFAWG